jgi:hypothetical protein
MTQVRGPIDPLGVDVSHATGLAVEHRSATVRETTDLHDATTNRRRIEAAARRDARMAELVAELTGVSPSGARHAIHDIDLRDPDPLADVARAIVTTRRPSPLRAPAYLDAG